jgi:hypothetical protein
MKPRDSDGIWKFDAALIEYFSAPNAHDLRSFCLLFFLCDFEVFGKLRAITLRERDVNTKATIHPISCHEGTEGE